MRYGWQFSLYGFLGLWLAMPAMAAPLRAEDQARLQALSASLQIPLDQLTDAVDQAQPLQPVLDAINRPWEAKPWYQYRALFLTPERIQAGARFWRDHADWLAFAQRRLHVPAEVILAIMGVETFYGTRMGNYPVLDALYTLGFLYPPRADYFSREFARYVRLAQQQGWDLRSPKGSYAGAMGMGQFMSTSYLTWAQDFDGDGHKDLFSNAADAIGSVGFYLADHGWQENSPVALPARIDDPAGVASLIDDKPDLTQTWQQLQAAGVHLSQTLPANTPVKLLRFQQAEGEEYWVACQNFYVITRYNRSPLYAMAVFQLSQELYRAYHALLR